MTLRNEARTEIRRPLKLCRLHVAGSLLAALIIASVLLSGCKSEGDAVLDTLGAAPFLTAASVQPQIVNTDTINVGPERKPEDMLQLQCIVRARVVPVAGAGEVDRVDATIALPGGGATLAGVSLHDDGVLPDSTAGDSLYHGALNFQIQRSLVGSFPVEIVAQSSADFFSNMARLVLRVSRLNQAPSLSQLDIPDTLTLGGTTQTILIQVDASDPDGLADIRRVSFNTFKPDDSPSSGNPWAMYDDGGEKVIGSPDVRSGDLVKGDGTYSLTVALEPTNQTGTYRFDFQAMDRSGALSTTLTHYLTVKP